MNSDSLESATSRIDASTMAAFIDGTLSPAEREQVLKHLETSREDRELLVATTALLAASHSTASRSLSGVPRLKRSAWARRGPLGVALVAAAASAVFVVRTRNIAARDASEFEREVNQYGVTTQLGVEWLASAWPNMRGGGPVVRERTSIAVSREASHVRDFRLGVRMTDAILASRTLDTAMFFIAQREVLQLVSSLPARGAIASTVSELTHESTLQVLAVRSHLISELDWPAWYALGEWTELQRASAHASQALDAALAMRRGEQLVSILRKISAADSVSSNEEQILNRLQRLALAMGQSVVNAAYVKAVLDSTSRDMRSIPQQ